MKRHVLAMPTGRCGLAWGSRFGRGADGVRGTEVKRVAPGRTAGLPVQSIAQTGDLPAAPHDGDTFKIVKGCTCTPSMRRGPAWKVGVHKYDCQPALEYRAERRR